MKIAPIKTEADYEAALAKIARLIDAKLNTPRGDELEVLVTLVEAYESKHWAIDPPDPIEAINTWDSTSRRKASCAQRIAQWPDKNAWHILRHESGTQRRHRDVR